MSGRTRAARGAAVGLVVLLGAGGLLAWRAHDGAPALAAARAEPAGAAGPTRYTGPQGRVGQFVVTCRYSHSAFDDPIVHFGEPGRSHRHDFYGATRADAWSRPEDLVRQRSTCDKEYDTAGYWQPTLYDHDVPVRPREIVAYYRAAPGVAARTVRPFPFGLALVAGDATATTRRPGEAAGWTCGSSSRLDGSAPECPASAPLHLVVTFPDCWDGEHLDAVDHHAHAAYSARGRCPASHPVHVPQLTVSVNFTVSGGGHDLRLASGNLFSAHADFLNGWEPAGLAREVDGCIHRNAVCDLGSNREEEPLFQHD